MDIGSIFEQGFIAPKDDEILPLNERVVNRIRVLKYILARLK